MYTEFLGRQFLVDYLAHRCSHLSNITRQNDNKLWYEEVLNIAEAIPEVIPLTDFDRFTKIQTKELLESLLRKMSKSKCEHAYRWVLCFVRRYEVNKKIYAHYGSNLTGGAGGTVDFKIYAMLGLALIIGYRFKKNLQLLSTSLKLNDHLIFLSQDMQKSEMDVGLLDLLLISELAQIREIAEGKGVVLSA